MSKLKLMPIQTIAVHIQNAWMVLNQLVSKLVQKLQLRPQIIESQIHLLNCLYHFLLFHNPPAEQALANHLDIFDLPNLIQIS